MNTLPLLIFLIIGCFCCEEQISFGYSSCTFYVHYFTNQCVNFSFNKCEWEQCTSYYYDSDDGSSHCIHYTTYSDNSWDSCTERCCDGDVDYPQTYSSITQCQDYLNSRFKLIMIIVFSVLGGILLIVFIACLCCGCCCECLYNCLESIRDCLAYIFCCQCFRRSNQREREEEPKYGVEDPGKQMTKISFQPKWRFQSLNNSKLKNICSVCLEDRPSLQLQCQHVFHRHCILTCLKKKHECILCRATEIDNIKLYCQQCFCAFYQTTLNESKGFIENDRQICDGCQEAGL